MIKSYESEKGEKETMEKDKSTKEVEHGKNVQMEEKDGLKVAETECRKLSVSEVDVSLTDNKSIESASEAKKSGSDEQNTEDNLLYHEKHIPGAITPPTVPVSPIVLEEVKFTSRTDALIKEVGLRSSTPASDDSEVVSSNTDITSEQLSRIGSHTIPLDRDSDEDEDQLSMTSQMALSRESSRCDDESKKTEVDPMSMSFYGTLPEKPSSQRDLTPSHLYELTKAKYSSVPIPDSRETPQLSSSDVMTSSFVSELPTSSPSHRVGDVMSSSFISEQPSAPPSHGVGDVMSSSFISELPSSSPSRGVGDVMSSSFVSEHPSSSPSRGVGDVMSSSFIGELPSSSEEKKDPIESWGKPLGLPTPPTHLHEGSSSHGERYGREARDGFEDAGFGLNRDSEQSDLMTASFYGELPSETKDPIESWGKPLGLPSPAPPGDNKSTPKKERKLPANVTAKNKLNDDKKRAESPSKYNRTKRVNPVYVDLTYVPHHGNSYYACVDFFRRVRARYYVFSGVEPSREVYDALLEAKQTWEDKDLEVTIIPTYDTDILGYWVAENEETLTKLKIDLSPSASRCTINLQDHETSCSAYRLEF
ncbi:unnamed protein product [Phaedon cochleariae]|uniref:Microtubule-associated protein futsch n=1 Tax=Phaedon cochleariae TaxID=80249 RepID=A0A9N9SFA1_PHACE|nr:unnamed protein product [Phaedon cochleariae]